MGGRRVAREFATKSPATLFFGTFRLGSCSLSRNRKGQNWVMEIAFEVVLIEVAVISIFILALRFGWG